MFSSGPRSRNSAPSTCSYHVRVRSRSLIGILMCWIIVTLDVAPPPLASASPHCPVALGHAGHPQLAHAAATARVPQWWDDQPAGAGQHGSGSQAPPATDGRVPSDIRGVLYHRCALSTFCRSTLRSLRSAPQPRPTRYAGVSASRSVSRSSAAISSRHTHWSRVPGGCGSLANAATALSNE